MVFIHASTSRAIPTCTASMKRLPTSLPCFPISRIRACCAIRLGAHVATYKARTCWLNWLSNSAELPDAGPHCAMHWVKESTACGSGGNPIRVNSRQFRSPTTAAQSSSQRYLELFCCFTERDLLICFESLPKEQASCRKETSIPIWPIDWRRRRREAHSRSYRCAFAHSTTVLLSG